MKKLELDTICLVLAFKRNFGTAKTGIEALETIGVVIMPTISM